MRNDLKDLRERFAGAILPEGPKSDNDSADLNGVEIQTHAEVDIDEDKLEHVVDALKQHIEDEGRILNIRDAAFQLALDGLVEKHGFNKVAHWVGNEYQFKTSIIPELQAETLRIALEIAPKEKLAQHVEEPKTTPQREVATPDITIQDASVADRAAKEFIAAFSGSRDSSLIKDIRREIVSAADGIDAQPIGYWGNKAHPIGEREGVFSTLKNVFSRVTNELTRNWKGVDKGRLAKALDQSESKPKLEKAIDLVVKQELTNAELEVGLRDKKASHSFKPGKITPERYQDEGYGSAAYYSAAAKIFTRLKDAFEQVQADVFFKHHIKTTSSTGDSFNQQLTSELQRIPDHVDDISRAYLEHNGATFKPEKTTANYSTKVDRGFDVEAFLEEPESELVPIAQAPQETVNRDWAKDKLTEFAVQRLGAVGVKDRALVPQVVIALWDYNEDGVTDALEAKTIVEEGLKFLAQKKGLDEVSKLDLDKEIFDEMRTLIENSINYGSFEPKSNMDSETRERGEYFKKLQAEVIAREDEEYLEILRDHYDNIYGPETSSDKKAA